MGNFEVTIVKKVGAHKPWRNRYHILMTAVTTLPDASLMTACQKIVALEQGIHLADVNFISMTISKVTARGTARTASDFVTVPLSVNGTVAVPEGSTEQLPNELCYKVSLVPTAGRNGFALYRRAIVQGAWSDASGEAQLVPYAHTQFNALIHPLFVVAGFPQLVLLPKNAGFDTEGRTVTDIQLSGIVARQETVKHKKKQTNSIGGMLAHGAEAIAGIVGLTQGLAWLRSKVPALPVALGEGLGTTIAEIEEILAAAGAAAL